MSVIVRKRQSCDMGHISPNNVSAALPLSFVHSSTILWMEIHIRVYYPTRWPLLMPDR